MIEAKRRDMPDTEGVGQAKQYAEKLQARFAYSTNGVGIYQIDMETGEEGYVDRYPTPDELWAQTFAEQNVWRDRFADVPFEDRAGNGRRAITSTTPSRTRWRRSPTASERILLTLATGTGKTFIAFQIAWKLFQSRWNLSREPTRRPRILFLADRNILADQAYNAFSAFPEDALVRIDPEIIRKKGRVPKNGSIFFTIFQTFMTGHDADGNPAPNFGDYPPDFFDFIVIDECHRGGANDESNWRGILEYFSPAVQLGLTATPKRTRQRRHLRLFRRAGLHLLAERRHQRRLPDAVQGEADRHHAGRVRLHLRRQADRRRDRGRQALHRGRLQPRHRDQGAREIPREAVHGRRSTSARRRWCSARRRTTRSLCAT